MRLVFIHVSYNNSKPHERKSRTINTNCSVLSMHNITLCVLSLRFCLSLGLFFMSDTIIYVTRVFCLYWLWCCIISHLISILCSTGECLHSHDLIWQLHVVILLFLYSTYIVMICTISLIGFFLPFTLIVFFQLSPIRVL